MTMMMMMMVMMVMMVMMMMMINDTHTCVQNAPLTTLMLLRDPIHVPLIECKVPWPHHGARRA